MSSTLCILPIKGEADLYSAVALTVGQMFLRRVEELPSDAEDHQRMATTWISDTLRNLQQELSTVSSWSELTRPDTFLLPQLQDRIFEFMATASERPFAETVGLMQALSMVELKQSIAEATGSPAEAVRTWLAALPVGDKSGSDFIWQEGICPDTQWAARIVPTADANLDDDARLAIGSVEWLLIAYPQSAWSTPQQNAVSQQASSMQLFTHLDDDVERSLALGRLCMLRDLLHLYGNAQRSGDERTAVAMVFAQAVQQQGNFIGALEAAGVRMHQRARTEVPAGASPEVVFRMGSHDVLREEIAAIQKAKEDGSMIKFGMDAYHRISTLCQAITRALPNVPTPPEGWVPSRKQSRMPIADALTYVAAYMPTKGVMAPVVACTRVADLQAQMLANMPVEGHA